MDEIIVPQQVYHIPALITQLEQLAKGQNFSFFFFRQHFFFNEKDK